MHDSSKSPDVSVCHTINSRTSPSICQSHDSSVSQPKCDSTWKSICPSVPPSSIPSIQPSANYIMNIPMSIPRPNFLKAPTPGKFSSICYSLDSSVNQSGSPSFTPSLSAVNQSKFPCNHGQKNMVKSLHEIPVKIPTVDSLSVTSVIAPINASSIPSCQSIRC